jgi:hypothetical protein
LYAAIFVQMNRWVSRIINLKPLAHHYPPILHGRGR